MIGRRPLLGGVAAAAAATLSACTLDGGVDWLPWTPPAALPVQPAQGLPEQLATVAALAGRLVDRAEAWKLAERRVASLEWFGAALAEHGQVLQSADPARRQRSTTGLPSVSPATTRTAAATTVALTGLLRRLQAEHRARALPATGPAALLWASLAAFSASAAVRLPTGFVRLGDDGADLTPDLTGPGTERVLALALQGAYAYELALAAPALSAADRAAFSRRLAAWRDLRTSVLALTPDATPSPPPVGYEARPATSVSAARALAVRVEGAALPVLGAWLAGTSSSSERRLGVDALAAANTALTGFGGAALRWPGWPG